MQIDSLSSFFPSFPLNNTKPKTEDTTFTILDYNSFSSFTGMAEAVMSFTVVKPNIHSSLQATKLDSNPTLKQLRQCSSIGLKNGWHQIEGSKSRRGSLSKVNALPDWPLMAVMVDHMEGQRDIILQKSVWHLNNDEIKNVYTLYIMFTVWGCCFFGATKDPYYDSEQYRKDGGDGTGHWVYEKQEDMEESARAELWREELIEEIEQKVGGLRELEEAGKKEKLVK
ncbi:photosynthetic NDH subunit of subcomplex B 4, chloroplastic isoform X1 [Rhododendron vialii]|uniref:photosynthetic NDH subunit of subcomplex B 4, chloroplastic isoform X1 n=1 Tax=Rhododendron vialii TaxID=182163 RepID=UPI00265E9013|nr:photosynthetic NDH subunit of subcomplex B 4, chloroplastic isoform X1 [Rhododendron vialii]